MRLVYSVQASRYGGARPYLRTLGLLLLLRACHENFDPRATVCAEPLATDSIVSVHVKLGHGLTVSVLPYTAGLEHTWN